MLSPIDANQKSRLGTRPLKLTPDLWNALSYWNASVMMVDIYRGEEDSDNKSIELMKTHTDQSIRIANKNKWTRRVIDSGWGMKNGFRAFMGNTATNFPKMKGRSYGTITLDEITSKIQAHRADLKVWMTPIVPVIKIVVPIVPIVDIADVVDDDDEAHFVGLEEVDNWEDL